MRHHRRYAEGLKTTCGAEIGPQKRGRTCFGLDLIQIEVSRVWVFQPRQRHEAD